MTVEPLAKIGVDWCEAPTKVKQAKGSPPVGHMSLFNDRVQQFLTASTERWLIPRNVDASEKIFVGNRDFSI